MKISGFTFIRNAIKYDYPIEEAILSILPLCDEVVVAVGKSEDDTLNLVRNIDRKKVKIIETEWDDSLREGGRVLALETDKAFGAISKDADWAIYIQGDEVLHESGIHSVKKAMETHLEDHKVEGLLFDYLHFYASYDYVGVSSRWYNKEVRVIRNDSQIYSFRDAQGFQKLGRPLRVKKSRATIHHYGWVKDPRVMQRKQEYFNKLWHDDTWLEDHVAKSESFDYSNIDALSLFNDSHPQIMQDRIQRENWQFDHDLSINKQSFKDIWKTKLAKWGLETGYRNYKLLK